MLAGAALKCSDSFKYLGMTYHRILNMIASSGHAAIPMLAAAHQIRGFVRDTALCDKPLASLWLAKAYDVPAVMYGCQVWSSGFLREGDVFRPSLQTLHLNFLKGTLGVKRSAPNWAILCECAHEPLQFYWFRAAIRFCNGMLSSSSHSATLKQTLHADLKLVPRAKTSGPRIFYAPLRDCEAVTLTRAFLQGLPICYSDFTADLRFRMRKVWRDIADMNPLESNNKLVTYHSWFACPLLDPQADSRARVGNGGAPLIPPRYLHLDFPKHVMRNVSRFRLRAHTLAVESSIWRSGNGHCSNLKCSCAAVQNEVHLLFHCQDLFVCSFRRKHSFLFFPFCQSSSMEAPYIPHALPTSSQTVFDFFSQRHNRLCHFISDIMDYFLAGKDQQHTNQPNGLAGGVSLNLPYFSQACSEDVFNFFQKQINDSYRFISELMDNSLWLVFSSNLNSQTTWLKVKLKLVNLF